MRGHWQHGAKGVIRERFFVTVRLIALDIDGTLLDSDRQLRPRVREAIAAAQRQGIVVTLATGRRYRGTAGVAAEAGIAAPLVLNNGNLVYDEANGHALFHQPLALRTTRLAISIMHDRGFAPVLYRHAETGPDVFYDRVTDDTWFWQWEPGTAEQVPNLLQAVAPAPDKLLVHDRRERIDELAQTLKQLLPGQWRSYVTDGAAPDYAVLELFHGACSKAAGLRRLARHLGIQRREVLAIGDHYNDVEMLAWAGHGVAMANAPPEVQRHARLLTRSNDEDGVAAAIERLALAGETLPAGSRL